MSHSVKAGDVLKTRAGAYMTVGTTNSLQISTGTTELDLLVTEPVKIDSAYMMSATMVTAVALSSLF